MDHRDQAKEQAKERFLQHIGSVIRKYRNRNSIDRHTLASALGCDDSTVSRYEHGTSDIKASTMAYISVLCNFPMYKYTELYGREPAAVVEDFKKLVKISAPVKHRKPLKDQSNRPPKPKLVFNEATWQWDMKESPVLSTEISMIEPESAEVTDYFFEEYINQMCDSSKRDLLLHLSNMVDDVTDSGRKKCPRDLQTVIRASVKYVINDKDRDIARRLMAYYERLKDHFKA